MKKYIRIFLLGLTFITATTPALTQDEPYVPVASTISEDVQTVTGFWSTQDKEAVVELYPCDGKICGRFHWLKEDSLQTPSLDDKNPDPEKQQRPLCGMQFMGGFTPMGHGYFSDGWIYSPRHGSTFNAKVTMQGTDKLELYGYFLITLFGEGQIWQRTGARPVCPLLDVSSAKGQIHASLVR